jgi:Protein of unknown function, DUF481
MKRWVCPLVCALIGLTTISAHAQAPSEPAAQPAAPVAEPAVQPAIEPAPAAPGAPTARVFLDAADPPDDAHDWVQLTNGEWMQGELLSLRDGTLEFDSDEFGVHKVDFEDVKRLFVRANSEFVLANLERVSGTALVSDGKLIVSAASGPVEADRKDIMSIVPAATSELERWSLRATLGLNLSRGNTSQATLSATSNVKREDGFTRLGLDYTGNYAETSGERTAHNHRGLGTLDLFLSRRFFVTPANVTAEYDIAKNIQFRITPAAGAGAHLIDNALIEWDLSVGGGYQYVDYSSVAAGEEDDAQNAAVSMGTTLDVELTDDFDLHFEYTNLLIVTDLGLTTHHLVTSVEADITSVFNLSVRFVFDRMEQPVEREDGSSPDENDFQIIASLGVELG